MSQEQTARVLGKSQSAIANKLRLLRHSSPVLDALRQAELTERHARALLRLSDEHQQLCALEEIARRGYNVERTEQYIEDLLRQNRTVPPRGRSSYIIKDVRLFLNSVDRGLRLIREAGISAQTERHDTEDTIFLTIQIPKSKQKT